jgi:hypothetical protein
LNSSTIVLVCAISLLTGAGPALGAPAEPDPDPLSLQSSAVSDSGKTSNDGKFFAEVAIGKQQQRYGLGSQYLGRVSLDYARSFKLGPSWRATLSDRLDALDPRAPGAQYSVLNSLREAYASWSTEGGERVIEFGRINLRNGPAYGYNPTDFLRAGALRAATDVDPIKLRQNRLGTVMLRGQQSWGDQTVSLALAPKLESTPDARSFSPDLGATNSRQRVLASWSSRVSERVSTQLLAFGEEGGSSQLGVNGTALLTDAVVAYGELTHGRDRSHVSLLGLVAAQRSQGSRLATGITVALPAKVSLSLEYSHNGFGLSASEWALARARGPVALSSVLQSSQVRQEQWSRNAWTVYATQQGFVLRSLDLTALVRYNQSDRSHLAWLELRHHWDGVDAAVQAMWLDGKALSEYGLPPARATLQALLVWYF